MRIIPAIDIIEGQCVRLTQGDYSQKRIYHSNPLEVAKEFEDNGIKYLHLVDLDGAKSNEIINWKTLERICSKTNLIVDFGGGIKTNDAIKLAFECGASQITGGSIAVKDEALFSNWISDFGASKIILGADTLDEKIAVGGWLENTDLNLFDFLKSYVQKGIEYVICTDISKDGLLQGTSIELYQKILLEFPNLKLIASGGVTSIAELDKLLEINTEGVIIGKAIYENKISLKELQKYVD